jgi:hypothetical protein
MDNRAKPHCQIDGDNAASREDAKNAKENRVGESVIDCVGAPLAGARYQNTRKDQDAREGYPYET